MIRGRRLAVALGAGALVAIGAAAAGLLSGESTQRIARVVAPARVRTDYVFPLKMSRNHRYLVDQHNTPFLVDGDAPQSMIANLSVADAAKYIADRKRFGFDALWVNLLCATYTGCRSDATTFDGIAPFTTPGDLSTPNPVYFARADAMIQLAAKSSSFSIRSRQEAGSRSSERTASQRTSPTASSSDGDTGPSATSSG